MSNTSTHSSTRRLTEGGICIALALVLSYLKIPIGLSFGGFGGSITLVMVPLILFAVRYGAPWGILAGVAFGTLKYFFAEGFAVSWVSIIFDYSVAYGAVGLAGLFRVKSNDYSKLPLAAFVGCLGRFVIHFISGVTVYAQYMPEEFMGMTMTSPVFYSVLYNGTYMLPNTILAIIICALLMKPAAKLPSAGEKPHPAQRECCIYFLRSTNFWYCSEIFFRIFSISRLPSSCVSRTKFFVPSLKNSMNASVTMRRVSRSRFL